MNSLVTPLFSEGTIVAESEVRPVDDQLMPEELACVRSAVDRRRSQFATGRLCAHLALERLGVPRAPLTVGKGGAPAWPQGVVGTISHTSSYCAAVVKSSPPWRSVGLDIEDLRPMDKGVLEAISTRTERRWLEATSDDVHHACAVLLFSAKEAFYKLQYPLTGRFLDFPEVEIEADLASGIFRAHPPAGLPHELTRIEGRFVFAAGKVLCGIELR